MKNDKSEEKMMAEIGKNIARFRKEKNMTQEELASILHVSPQAVSKWENEISCPDITLLPQLSAVFGVSVDALLGVVPSQEPPAQTEQFSVKNEEPEPPVSENPIREIKITVTKPDGKAANIRLPIKVVRFGLDLGQTFGGLEREHVTAIEQAIRQGLRGEILNVTSENEETVTICIE